MGDLTNSKIKDTFGELLHVAGGVDGTTTVVEDGDGTNSALEISTTDVKSSGTLTVTGAITGSSTATLEQNLTINGSATEAAYIELAEDTDNGTNKVKLQAPASTADVTVTLPAATDTLIGKATTDTLTNKTFDANGTGNSLSNVDVADLANGTDGELITWDAAGAPATVAAGTSGHVLTSNGAGAAPTFQKAGKILQVVESTTTTAGSTTTTIPSDNSIPQNTEGTEILTVSITPNNTNNRLLIKAVIPGFGNTVSNSNASAALFQDSTADAIATAIVNDAGDNNGDYVMVLYHTMTAGTVSSTTFKLRVGPGGNTSYWLRRGNGARYGGTLRATLEVMEYEV